MTIKHEKIAALVRILPEPSTGRRLHIYRLSHPLPYGDEIEKTWFVSIQSYPHLNESFVYQYPVPEGRVCPLTGAFGADHAAHARALDALGYELIEEEK